jgi:hypothetical protein
MAALVLAVAAGLTLLKIRQNRPNFRRPWPFRAVEVPVASLQYRADGKVEIQSYARGVASVQTSESIEFRDSKFLCYGLVTRIGPAPPASGEPFVLEVQRLYKAGDLLILLGQQRFDALLATYRDGGLQIDLDRDMFMGAAGELMDVYPSLVLGKITVVDKGTWEEMYVKPGLSPAPGVLKLVARYDAELKKLTQLHQKIRSVAPKRVVHSEVSNTSLSMWAQVEHNWFLQHEEWFASRMQLTVRKIFRAGRPPARYT